MCLAKLLILLFFSCSLISCLLTRDVTKTFFHKTETKTKTSVSKTETKTKTSVGKTETKTKTSVGKTETKTKTSVSKTETKTKTSLDKIETNTFASFLFSVLIYLGLCQIAFSLKMLNKVHLNNNNM